MRKIAAAAVLLLALTGCQTTNQTLGTTLGAVGGGLVGSQIGGGSGRYWATAGGVLAGALIGNQVGAYLDAQDQQKLASATQQTFETGKTQRFSNPQTGVSATTKIVETPKAVEAKVARLEDKEQCNTVQQQITLKDGSQKVENITACKGPDGWYQV